MMRPATGKIDRFSNSHPLVNPLKPSPSYIYHVFSYIHSELSDSSEDSVCDQRTVLRHRSIATNGASEHSLVIREDGDISPR